MRGGFLVLALIFSAQAFAAPDPRAVAREHYEKGSTAFDLGDYDEAIREYEAAYRAKDDPALLYNLAQAHRLAGHLKDAARFYRVYLTRSPNAPNRAEVEGKLAELERAIEHEQRSQHALPPDGPLKSNAAGDTPPSGTPKPAQPPPATVPSPAPTPPPTLAVMPEKDSPPADAPGHPAADRRLKIAGLSTAVAGVAVAAVGFGMLGLEYQAASDYHSVSDATARRDAKSSFDLAQTLTPVFLGIGGAAVVAGAVTYAIGWHRSRSPRLTVTPMASSTSVGVAAAGRW